MGFAVLPTRPLGARTMVRAPVMRLHATGLRRLALGRRVAATRADTVTHRILRPTDAVDPSGFETASAQAVAHAANPVPPGEMRGQVLLAGTVMQPWWP